MGSESFFPVIVISESVGFIVLTYEISSRNQSFNNVRYLKVNFSIIFVIVLDQAELI